MEPQRFASVLFASLATCLYVLAKRTTVESVRVRLPIITIIPNNSPHRRRDGYTRSVSTASSQYVDQTKGMAVPCEQVQILSDAMLAWLTIPCIDKRGMVSRTPLGAFGFVSSSLTASTFGSLTRHKLCCVSRNGICDTQTEVGNDYD